MRDFEQLLQLTAKVMIFFMNLLFKGIAHLIGVLINSNRERTHKKNVAAKNQNQAVSAAAQAPISRPPRLSDKEDAYDTLDDARAARLRYSSIIANPPTNKNI